MDKAVDGFDGTLGVTAIEEGDDAFPVLFDGGGQSDKGPQAASLSPSAPPFQKLWTIAARAVCVLQRATQAEGSAEFLVALCELAAHLLLVFAQVPFVAAQRPQAALQISPLGLEVFAHALDGFSRHHHYMIAIIDNLRLREVLSRAPLKAVQLVHHDVRDPLGLSASFDQLVSKGSQRFSTSSGREVEQPPRVRIEDHRHVIPALAHTRLIDCDRLHLAPVALFMRHDHSPEPRVHLPPASPPLWPLASPAPAPSPLLQTSA